jgi:glycosyltransferase involved in cell wall biosynthesis
VSLVEINFIDKLSDSINMTVALVIATFNSSLSLEKCLRSCLSQTFQGLRVYVVDGGSSDGTLEIISGFKNVSLICSENDLGIYDAWNKALRVINFDWVCFLGADDFFYSESVIEKMVTKIPPGINFLSGQAVEYEVSSLGEIMPLRTIGSEYSILSFKKGMPAIHVGALHSKELFQDSLFDSSYKIIGDYHFLSKKLKVLNPLFLNFEIVFLGVNGISRTKKRKMIEEMLRLKSEYGFLGIIDFLSYLLNLILSTIKRKLW